MIMRNFSRIFTRKQSLPSVLLRIIVLVNILLFMGFNIAVLSISRHGNSPYEYTYNQEDIWDVNLATGLYDNWEPEKAVCVSSFLGTNLYVVQGASEGYRTYDGKDDPCRWTVPVIRKDRNSNKYNGTLVLTSHPKLQQILDYKQYKTAADLLGSVSGLFISNNISFIMAGGMLMGSYLYHDFIPWTDDMEIFIDIYDLFKFQRLFQRPDLVKVYSVTEYYQRRIKASRFISLGDDLSRVCKAPDIDPYCIYKYKISLLDSTKSSRYKWNDPLINVFFTLNNGTHVYNLQDWRKEKPIVLKIQDFYPTVQRPFNRHWIPGPRNPKTFLDMDSNRFMCRDSSLKQMRFNLNQNRMSPCQELRSHLPYVVQKKVKNPSSNGVVSKRDYYPELEFLIVNDTLLNVVLIEG